MSSYEFRVKSQEHKQRLVDVSDSIYNNLEGLKKYEIDFILDYLERNQFQFMEVVIPSPLNQ